ncbi:MAG: hypothetical protein MI702_12440, partial [Chlorobiales bacterium]|nr:hypothetical protein [Chlorobiales bacterium]
GWKLHRMRKQVQKDPANKTYTDFAIQPVEDAEEENLEIFNLNDASREAVAKAKRQKEIVEKTRKESDQPMEPAQ